MKINEQYSKKLLVEGNDDQHVISALCEQFDIKETFDVIDCEGIFKLLNQIPIRLKQSGINAEVKNKFSNYYIELKFCILIV